jgi:hypothetical protein
MIVRAETIELFPGVGEEEAGGTTIGDRPLPLEENEPQSKN